MKKSIRAYAKINLSLDVTGKRDDRYHTLSSVMQSVSLCDDITIETADENIIVCGDDIPSKDNLALKAAQLFLDKADLSQRVKITLKKQIPLAAGLGGGSADAAAVLVLLNHMFHEPFSNDELLELALKLGADVPFCINGGTALANGIGEQLTELKAMPDCTILIVKKGIKSSTGDMYRRLDSTTRAKTSRFEVINDGLKCGDLDLVCSGLYNCFEEVCGGEVAEIKDRLIKNGAIYAGLSGAGPSVFGIFKSGSAAEKAKAGFESFGALCFICRPVLKANEIF